MQYKHKLEKMLGNRKNQNAGSNSNQIQGDNVTVIVGIDEKRAREIYSEMTVQLKKEYTAEALMVANARIIEFENKLLPKMEAVDGALESFADPSFQLLLIEAQKTAAATERPVDYELLAELLVQRFKNNKDRNVVSGINIAVEVVDEVADDALLGLTILHALTYFIPIAGDPNEGLYLLDEFFGKLLYDKLPKGNNWYEHLELLNAVKVNSFGNAVKLESLFNDRFPGYVDVGIEKNSKNHIKALKILNDADIHGVLVDHYLNNNFVRINMCNIRSIRHLKNIKEVTSYNYSINDLTDIQEEVIIEVYHLYKKDEIAKQENIYKFIELWDNKENLKTIRLWWNSIGSTIKLTSVGRVLSQANAQRFEINIPILKL